jgi:hypothetical protein
MCWMQLTLLEDGRAHFDPLSGLVTGAHTLRRRVPQRLRLRCLLPERNSFSQSQFMARRAETRRQGDEPASSAEAKPAGTLSSLAI